VSDLTGCDLARDAYARRARKRPLPVAVEFAARPGVVQTLEGPVRFRGGDALLTGIAGERWPIGRVRFDAAYEPIPPTVAGSPGRYRRRPLVVWARCMARPFRVRVGWAGDALHGRPGDWLLQYGPGDYGIVAAALFAQTYDLLDGDGDGDGDGSDVGGVASGGAT